MYHKKLVININELNYNTEYRNLKQIFIIYFDGIISLKKVEFMKKLILLITFISISSSYGQKEEKAVPYNIVANQTERDSQGRWLISANEMKEMNSTAIFNYKGTNNHIIQIEDNPPLKLYSNDIINDLDDIARDITCYDTNGEKVTLSVNNASVSIYFEGDNNAVILIDYDKFIKIFSSN